MPASSETTRTYATARRIGILVLQQFQLLDAAGPIAAFEAARRIGAPCELAVFGPCEGPIESSSGVALVATSFFTEICEQRPLDTLIVAGGDAVRQVGYTWHMVPLLCLAAQRVRRVASVCTGAYFLAEAGLLNGRRATTHWFWARQFRRRFPRVRLELERVLVRDGICWTSGGSTAGIDLALALLAEDFGERFARRVAQHLAFERRHPGGQSSLSAVLESAPLDHRFRRLIQWMREHVQEDLAVDRLARQVAMSPRHFTRVFRSDTGMTPARAVERVRVEAARERIEHGTDPITRIAIDTGFGGTARMRAAFLRTLGQVPQALRRSTKC